MGNNVTKKTLKNTANVRNASFHVIISSEKERGKHNFAN